MQGGNLGGGSSSAGRLGGWTPRVVAGKRGGEGPIGITGAGGWGRCLCRPTFMAHAEERPLLGGSGGHEVAGFSSRD